MQMADMAEIVTADADDRASILAEMPEDVESEDVESKTEADDDATEEKSADADETSDDESESQDDEAEAEDAAAPEPEAVKEPEDEVKEKRIAAIKEEERVSRQRMDEYLASKKREIEQEWGPRIEAAQRWERIEKQGSHDPIAILEQLGYTGDSLEDVARAAYAASPAGMKDPRLKESAQVRSRVRQQDDRFSELEQKYAQLEERFLYQQQESQMSAYVGMVVDAIGDEAPILRNMLERNPSALRSQLREEVQRVERDTGEVPDPATLVAHYERIRRQVLEDSGVDPSLIGGIKPRNAATKQKTPEAGEKEAAKPMSSQVSTTTKPRSEPKTEEEEREWFVSQLANLENDDE